MIEQLEKLNKHTKRSIKNSDALFFDESKQSKINDDRRNYLLFIFSSFVDLRSRR